MIGRICSLIIILFLLPLFLVVSFLIILIDRQTPIYIQKRIGKENKVFNIFKFKTMKDVSPQHIKSIEKKDYKEVYKDQVSRVTKLGGILRSTSIDELPQFFNVLNGSMSLIGPRPLIPEQRAAIPTRFICREKVLPGLTGLAQAKGRRSLSWISQLRYDRFYIENFSVKLDCYIVIWTIKSVVFKQGIEPKKGRNWREYL